MAKKEQDIPFTKAELAATPAYIRGEVAKDPKKQKLIREAEIKDKARPAAKPRQTANFPAAPEAKASVTPVKTAKFTDASVKITMLVKENPHQANSNRSKAFIQAAMSKTVADYLKGGAHCKAKYLAKWQREKLLKLGA